VAGDEKKDIKVICFFFVALPSAGTLFFLADEDDILLMGATF
jgi:hypothetical protein